MLRPAGREGFFDEGRAAGRRVAAQFEAEKPYFRRRRRHYRAIKPWMAISRLRRAR